MLADLYEPTSSPEVFGPRRHVEMWTQWIGNYPHFGSPTTTAFAWEGQIRSPTASVQIRNTMPPKKESNVTFRIKNVIDNMLGRNEPPTPPSPSPSPSNPGGIPTPPRERASSYPFPVPMKGSVSGPCISLGVKPNDWESLKRLMGVLEQAANISELEPIKSIIRGLVELIGLYEDVAQGQKEFDDLRLQLECIFDELSHYLSCSPVITTSMDSICWSMQKEIEVIRARQARPRERKPGKADDDASVVLECYRRLQDHLQRLTRNANLKTWHIVDQLATDHRLEKLASSSWGCYNSGKAADLTRGPCTQGTRINVLAQMHQWATGRNTGNIYWMSGMAGTGKTTIAYSLCEQLDAETNRLLCASFFCSRSLPECRDVGRIIPSIAYQLAQFSRPFRYALSLATEKDPLAHTRLPQMQFESLIVQPLLKTIVREAFPTNMVAVIDALDECDDVKSTRQILDVLLTKSRGLPIKFVVSSRPEPAIRDQMEKNGTWVDARVVLHELDNGEVKTDIKTYLTAELAPVKALESDIDRLAERAGVLFIYAATVVRYVGHDDFTRGRARLKAIMDVSKQQSKAQTEEIDQLYGTILEAAVEDTKLEPADRDDIKLILHMVICTRAPLSVAALSKLLQLDDVDRVQAAIRPLWSVLHVMGSNMTVTTLHASFPDFLLDPKRSGTWYCNAATHHQLLAQRCFECIRDTKCQFNICRLESSYLFDSEVADLDARVQKFIPSELRYSCQYWSSHLGVADSATASDIIPLLSQFLTIHLLLWMEVMNLTKSASTTVDNLMAAKRWGTLHGVTRDMIDLLSDAWRFAWTFVSGRASQSTPHLYVSMLPLLPPSSPVRKHYWGQFKGLIEVKGTALERRRDELLAQWKFEVGVGCMACSPDGTRVAIGGGAGTWGGGTDCIVLLSAFSGNLLLELSHDDRATVQSIAFSPDGAHLASGRDDGAISVWDVTTGQSLLAPLVAHNDCVSSILYSHGGSYIVSASRDKTIRIWDSFFSKYSPTPLIEHTSGFTCLAITSDDARLVSGSLDGTICVWGVRSGKMILDPLTANDKFISAITLSPGDSYIVSGSSDGNIRVWDSQTGQMVLGPLRDQGGQVKSLSVSPDGATIASTSTIAGVRVWDSSSRAIISQLGPFSDEIDYEKWATYSPDGTRIIFARKDGTVRSLDAQSAAKASGPLSGHTSYIMSVDVSPNGRHVVSGSSDRTLCIWDVAQGILLLGPLQGHADRVNMVRFSTDGSRVVSCAKDSTIRQWDAQSGAVHGKTMEIASAGFRGVVSATYSRDGAHIISLTHAGALSVWDSSSGQSIWGLIDALNKSNGIYADFSPDNTTIITGYEDGFITTLDVQKGQVMFRHRAQMDSKVSSLAFSPDGLYCAQSYNDGKTTLKIVHTGEQIAKPFEGHTRFISSVRYSPGGAQLVTGSDDKTIHVWDLKTRQSLLGPLNGHAKAITSVAFSPDGKYVVSASWDLVIRVWNIEPKAPSVQDAEYADWVLNEDGWRLKFDGVLIGEAWAGCFGG